jgi:hypothetical protein
MHRKRIKAKREETDLRLDGTVWTGAVASRPTRRNSAPVAAAFAPGMRHLRRPNRRYVGVTGVGVTGVGVTGVGVSGPTARV